MDCTKAGAVIYHLRKEKRMTQRQLAEKLNISDKTVSKWERGFGCPDVSLLNDLSLALGTDIESVLRGSLAENSFVGGNMKKSKFYVCPLCGNVVVSTGEASVSCCGRRLEALCAQKADEAHTLTVETIETEWFITSAHPMEKQHYLSFAALATGDKLLLAKQYPEWNLQARLPRIGHGILYTYCTLHGLFYQVL